MNLSFAAVGAVQVAVVEEPRIDAHTAPSLKREVGERLAGRAHLVLDLSSVDFIDSSGLAAFLSLRKRLPAEGQLRLCGVRAPLRDVLALTRLDRIFDVHADRAEALRALGEEPA